MEFHWWYIPILLFAILLIFGKGGIVRKRFTANMQVLDNRFETCRPEMHYVIFKEGQPEKIDLEIDDLDLPVGDELEFRLNNIVLANVKVKRDREAEFEHWSDDGVDFPAIKEGDLLEVYYQGTLVMKGTFALE